MASVRICLEELPNVKDLPWVLVCTSNYCSRRVPARTYRSVRAGDARDGDSSTADGPI